MNEAMMKKAMNIIEIFTMNFAFIYLFNIEFCH